MAMISALENNPICPTHRLSRNTHHPRHYSITRMPPDPETKNPDPRGHHTIENIRRRLGIIRHIAIAATGPTSVSAAIRVR